MALILDAMGGDHAPDVVVDGALKAASEGISVVLVGQSKLYEHRVSGVEGIELVNASQIVTMSESPADAFRKKPDSSIAVGLKIAKERGVPFISAGNTGACMAGALFTFGRIPGIKRPPIASVFPSLSGNGTVILDVGANVDCDADNLVQFAMLGSVYASVLFGVQSPRVALLSNGEEEEKGNALVHSTHQKLKESSINFVGNLEGHDLLLGKAEVIVTDGFTGNVLLKTAEGISGAVHHLLKKTLVKIQAQPSVVEAILGALGSLSASKPENCAAPLLGLNGACYIVHGGADARTIHGALIAAQKVADSGLLDKIRQGFKG